MGEYAAFRREITRREIMIGIKLGVCVGKKNRQK